LGSTRRRGGAGVIFQGTSCSIRLAFGEYAASAPKQA